MTQTDRAQELFLQHQDEIYARTDRLFGKLFLIEYLAGIVAAVLVSPRTWSGSQSSVHVHVIAAVVLGAIIFALPLLLIKTLPGRAITRHVIGISQMLFSALLIHLTGGRIETHFHVFGSLAFLAFYRDWRVLISASVVVAADHLLRGLYWPSSVYGILSVEQWRWLEHTGWVLFEDVVLILASAQSVREMWTIAERQADSEAKTSRLIESETEFRTIFELSGSGKFEICGRTRRFRRVNSKLAAIAGYTVEEMLGLNIEDLFPAPERAARLKFFEQLVHGGQITQWDAEKTYQRRDGSTFWALMSATIIRDESGQAERIIATLQDINDRKRAEEELADAKFRAEDASRAKSAFLANMSHEIRTPLGAMLGFAQLMVEDKTFPGEQRKKLDTVLRNGEQLYRIINDILDLSKVEANKFEIEPIRFDLGSVINDVVALLSHKAQEKGLEFNIKSIGPLPESIVSDPTRLRQILMNVIGNAIKFTERGHVSVNFRFRELSTLSTVLEVVVEDSGPGIAAGVEKHLFQPFSQEDNATSRRFGGTGLGLYLSRRLAQALGGDVTLEKHQAGKGCRFKVTLETGPLEARSLHNLFKSDIHLVAHPAEEAALAKLDGIQCLVVDDSADNLELTEHFLAGAGVSVECLGSAVAALPVLAERAFDVVIMDIQMPRMDGYEAIRHLRQKGYSGPVLALTAHAMKGERERCLAAGFDGYLVKPIDKTALITAVYQHAQRVRPLGPPAEAPIF